MTKANKTTHRGPIALGPLEPQDKLAAAMKAEGWPIQELAQEIGADRAMVRYLIQGKHRPRRDLADAICEVLGKEWEDLFTYRRPKYKGAN